MCVRGGGDDDEVYGGDVGGDGADDDDDDGGYGGGNGADDYDDGDDGSEDDGNEVGVMVVGVCGRNDIFLAHMLVNPWLKRASCQALIARGEVAIA